MLRASLQLWQSLSCAKIVIVGQRSQKEGQEPKTQSKPKQNLKTTTTPSNRNVLDQSSKGEIRWNNLRLSRQSTISGSTFSAENSQKLHVNEHSLFTRKLQGWSWWRNHQSWVCAVLQACHAIGRTRPLQECHGGSRCHRPSLWLVEEGLPFILKKQVNICSSIQRPHSCWNPWIKKTETISFIRADIKIHQWSASLNKRLVSNNSYIIVFHPIIFVSFNLFLCMSFKIIVHYKKQNIILFLILNR